VSCKSLSGSRDARTTAAGRKRSRLRERAPPTSTSPPASPTTSPRTPSGIQTSLGDWALLKSLDAFAASVATMDVFLMIRRKKTTLFLDAKENTSVSELKKMIEGITKQPPNQQRLYSSDDTVSSVYCTSALQQQNVRYSSVEPESQVWTFPQWDDYT
jgi:hypothetical protein